MPDPRHELGIRAEVTAARWLQVRGWRILARRWRSASGEIDLVCNDEHGALVAVEVKLRTTARAGGPIESVDTRRVRRLRRVLADYALTAGHGQATRRVDLVGLERSGDRWRLRHERGIDGW
jgi:putative endonuclease